MITVQYRDFDDMVATSKYIASLVGGNAAITAAPEALPQMAVTPEEPEKPQKQEPVEQPEEKTAEPVASGKTYTLEEVRAKLAELNKSGKRAEVKSLLGAFGAAKLSDIPADKYGELMEKAGEF